MLLNGGFSVLYSSLFGMRFSQRALLAVVLLLLMAASASLGLFLRPESSLPVHLINQSGPWASETTCIECHHQAIHFAKTGHANTLLAATSQPSLDLLKRFEKTSQKSTNITLDLDSETVTATHHPQGENEQQITLDWCFGSGKHARTWVGLLPDSWGADDLVEFRYTWYSKMGAFDTTPGQPSQPDPGYFGHLGVLYDHPKTRRCFACHATRLQLDHGEIDFHTMLPGVTCQRCHGPRGEHVTTIGKVGFNQWRGIDHVEAVHRCAECHRREEDVKGEQIVPENTHLARFQPVGLMRSKCFESEKMTCTICHDPHLPLAQQQLDQAGQCVQCHDGATAAQPVCAAGHQDSCVECHMPKVKSDNDLYFTDHWIRVRY